MQVGIIHLSLHTLVPLSCFLLLQYQQQFSSDTGTAICRAFLFRKSSKTESAAIRSIGSNMSSVSGDMNTQNTGIGSLIVDVGTAKGDDKI